MMRIHDDVHRTIRQLGEAFERSRYRDHGLIGVFSVRLFSEYFAEFLGFLYIKEHEQVFGTSLRIMYIVNIFLALLFVAMLYL